jgi:hypothetical protein
MWTGRHGVLSAERRLAVALTVRATVWRGIVQHSIHKCRVSCNIVVRGEVVWCGMVQYGVDWCRVVSVWYDMEWCGTCPEVPQHALQLRDCGPLRRPKALCEGQRGGGAQVAGAGQVLLGELGGGRGRGWMGVGEMVDGCGGEGGRGWERGRERFSGSANVSAS